MRLVVTYPAGNTTAIVLDDLTNVDREQFNSSILKTWQTKYPDKPQIEQCCFVVKPNNSAAIGRVEMFGGEFCGNATRSVVWLLTKGKDGSGFVETSGSSKALKYIVENGVVSLEMPTSEIIQSVKGLAIKFEGITQLVTPEKDTRAILQQLIENDALAWSNLPAIGVTNYIPVTKQAQFSVWVKDVNTIFDETACGSGTAAIGIARAYQTKQTQQIDVIQPSGKTIQVTADASGKAQISGGVNVMYEGEMELA